MSIIMMDINRGKTMNLGGNWPIIVIHIELIPFGPAPKSRPLTQLRPDVNFNITSQQQWKLTLTLSFSDQIQSI